MKIYTKFGDKGATRLIGGECVDKSNPRVDCYGDVDELNSQIGLVSALMETAELNPAKDFLFQVQNQLFNLGALLACSKPQDLARLPQVDTGHIIAMEVQIDQMTDELSPLTNFILPGGSVLCAQTHVARTICRRAERSTVALSRILSETKADLLLIEKSELAVQYLNRLSDYLFTLARYAAKKTKVPEVLWQKN